MNRDITTAMKFLLVQKFGAKFVMSIGDDAGDADLYVLPSGKHVMVLNTGEFFVEAGSTCPDLHIFLDEESRTYEGSRK